MIKKKCKVCGKEIECVNNIKDEDLICIFCQLKEVLPEKYWSK